MSGKKVQINVKEDLKQEEKLIAVMLLETYSNNFRPFSQKKAECLLPLIGGKTQLDRNVEYLIENKVEEIYLFCTSHHSQIRTHLSEERLKNWRSQGCEVHFLYNFKCQGVGDAMREIDAKGLVRSNFILVTASTVISNIKLSEYLDTHKSVSKLDKNCVMTMICQDRSNDLTYGSNLNETSFSSQPNTVIIHNNTNRILHYDKVKLNPMDRRNKSNKYVNLPVELFQNAYRTSKQVSVPLVNDSSNDRINESDIGVQSTTGVKMNSIQHLKTIQHRNDLSEAGIYLCSPYVLHMFTDNFDYENMSDYIRGVLIEEEVAGYTCYIDIIKKKFKLHYSIINNINTYYFEMMRIIQRIDLILNEKECASYKRLSDRISVHISENGVKLGSNLQINKNCVVDSNCTIGNNCELVNCYVSTNCKIGDNVKLLNCIVWPNTQIGNNSRLTSSFLGFNVKIGNECTICENCLIANDCHVKDNSKLTQRGVYSLKTQEGFKTKSSSTNQSSFSVLEDNYTKYFLNDANIDDENESDDDFGSIDGEENFEDDASIESENDEVNDTSKNYHFYVWKTKSKTFQVQNRLRRNSEDSESALDSCHSDLSDGTSDEYEQDTEEEEYDEYADDNDGDIINEEKITKIADEDHQTFVSETTEILQRGLMENLNPDNLILEINSCKHANNIPIEDLLYFLPRAILNLPIVMNKHIDLDKLEYLSIFKSYVKKSIGELFLNYYTKTKQSQKTFLDSTLDFFIEIKQVENVYVKLIHYLYNDIDFLSETVINEWYEEKLMKLSESKADADALLLIKRLQPFIDWLQESEEESDEDDAENDDDEE